MDQLEGLQELTEIGRGGFGVVYRAHETDLNRTVAVKVLNEASADLAQKRLDRERRAMGVLSGHPNIVTIYRTGTTGGSPYLVMEFLGGGSLADRLHHGPPIPWQEAVNIGTSLADAIDAAHRAGVFHRDIKPANVLLSDTGVPKLGDFGIANVEAVSQTSGVMKATVAHAPPEVLGGSEGDARSDIYSLASTMYELITGRPAFVRPEDTSPVPVMMRITSEAVPDVDPAICPPAVTRCLQQAMAKDPAHRPATAADFRDLLIAATNNPDAPLPGGFRAAPAAGATGGHQTVHAFAPNPGRGGQQPGPSTGPGHGAAPPPSGPAQQPAAFHRDGAAPPPGYTGAPSGPVGHQPPGAPTPGAPPGHGGFGTTGVYRSGNVPSGQGGPAPHTAPPGYQTTPFHSSGPTPSGLGQQYGSSGSNTPVALIVGGVVAALIVIVGAALLLTRSDGDDPDIQTLTDPTTGDGTGSDGTIGDGSDGTTETTAPTTAPTTQSTTQPTTQLLPTAPLLDTSTVAGRTAALELLAAQQLVSTDGFASLPTYPGGVTPFSDNAGVITGEAPLEWSDRQDATEAGFSHGVQVATNLPGTQEGSAESGVVVFLYPRANIEATFGTADHDNLIAEIIRSNEINCSEAPHQSFSYPQFTGRYTILTNCVASDPNLMGLYMVGTLNQSPDYLLQVTLLTSDPESIAAAQAAIDSIQINLANV